MAGINLEILAYEPSPLGMLCLRRREPLCLPGTIITEVTLNHEFLMSSLYTESERSLSEIGIEFHSGENLKVLIGGLGLGYTAIAAVGSDRVSSAEVVEFLPQVIDWTKKGLVPLSEELNASSKLTITPGDIYQRLASEPTELFDLVLIDVDHSPDDRLDSGIGQFYTTDGLRAARKHLAPDGALGVWSYAESSPFADSLRDVFNEVRVEGVTHYNELVNEEHTDWLFFGKAPSIDP